MATDVIAAEDYILKFEIVPGRYPEVDSVAKALTAWVEVLRASAEAVDPASLLSVELAGVENGSQLFKLLFRKLEAEGQRIKEGGKEFPLVSKAAIALGGLIGGTVITVGITTALTPDPRIPADQMAVFNQMNENLAKSVKLQEKSMQFYETLQDEPAFESIKVLRGYDRVPFYEVPRSEFAARGGLWGGDIEEATPQFETRKAIWDVTLIKPALIAEPRRWTFARDGLEFTALMSDPMVLQAIHDKTLPIQIAEGVMMKIEVSYRERFDGTTWIPIPASRKVKKVLYPLPPPPSSPLFPSAGRP